MSKSSKHISALVGAALAKGNATKKKKKHNSAITTLSHVPATKSTSAYGDLVSFNRMIKRTNPRNMHTMQTYIKSLEDPFNAPPGKLGFGCFVPTALHSGWYTVATTIPTGKDCFSISACVNCSATGSAVGYPTNVLSTLGSGFTFNMGVKNAATIDLQAQTGRRVSAALRVVASCPMTSARGRLGGIFIPDDALITVDNTSINNIQNMAQYRDFHPSGSSDTGGQVAYRPADNSDYEFATITINGASNTTNIPIFVVVGSGWPTGTTFTCSFQIHVETLGGLDISGDDEYTPPSFTLDQVANKIGTLSPAVTPSISAVDMMDMASNNVSRSARRSGFGRGSLGSLSEEMLTKKLAAYSAELVGHHFPKDQALPPVTSSSSSPALPVLQRGDTASLGYYMVRETSGLGPSVPSRL
jgi:hypothetical protein